VINAMAPAEVASIVMDEENGSMDIAVEESNLSQAIGRGGQNVRLASELSGWTLNVLTIEQAEQKSEEESRSILERFMQRLDVGEDVANILVQEGFSNIEEIAYVPESELLEIEEFDEEIVTEIRRRARDALLTQLIAKEEVLDENAPEDDLLVLEGMTERLAFKLAEKGFRTQEDLAELSVDELKEIDEMTDEEAAGLIMAARAPWFAEEE
jgi:N utilization substance protein A